MEKKEPYASKEEFNQRVVHYPDVPLVELAPGSNSHLVSAVNMTVSFITIEPNKYFPPHHHEAEQIVVVLDGECDQIVDGKLYPLKKGDVIIIPSNVDHGDYVYDKGLKAIEIFSPAREDLAARLKKALAS
jgi:quercetin dioxygenase-like cupin family protein